MPLVGAAYDKCTGCSETVCSCLFLVNIFSDSTFLSYILQVLRAYETQGFSMLLEAFNDTKYLEKLTGLDKLFDDSEAALESVDWDDDDDDDKGAGDDF
jgi:ubiquitin-like modifier-activating enzyme ATG7